MDNCFHDDLARNIIIGAVSFVPYVGGPIGLLMDKYCPNAIERNYQSFINQFETDLNKCREYISVDRFQTDEFAMLFSKVLEKVVVEQRRERLIAYENILLNCSNNPGNSKTEYFLQLIDSLPIESLHFLHLIHHCQEYDNELSPVNLQAQFPNIKEHINSFVLELVRARIIYQGSKLTPLGVEFCDFAFAPLSM